MWTSRRGQYRKSLPKMLPPRGGCVKLEHDRWGFSVSIGLAGHCAVGSWGGQRPSLVRLCHGDGGHEGGDRRRSVLKLPTLWSTPTARGGPPPIRGAALTPSRSRSRGPISE